MPTYTVEASNADPDAERPRPDAVDPADDRYWLGRDPALLIRTTGR